VKNILIALFVITQCCVAYAAPAQKPASGDGIVMTQEELRFIDLVNKERADRGLSQLVPDPLLVRVARGHSREMAEKDYFSHTSPTPGIKTPLDRYLALEKHRPMWALVGENLYYCSLVDVDRGHVALMNSKGHRQNILEPKYERIGVGAHVDEKGQFFVTETFLAKTD